MKTAAGTRSSSGRISERHRYGIVISMTFAFDPIPTSKLRLAFQSAAPVAVENISVFETERVDLWENKAGKAKFPPREDPLDALAAATVPPKAIAKDQVIDLTKMMRPDGTLEWDAPPGEWNILRIGYTTTGATNKPSSEAGQGLETDKMSRSAVNHHIDSFGRKLIDRLQAAAPGSVHSIHTDSWKIGPQTWTACFAESFRRLRGYDPTPYLPVLAGGAAVGSRMESNRFLWDVRHTWADLIKTDFFEELRDISHGMGILYQSESTGTQMTHCDPINYNSVVDIPIGEFWQDGTFIHPDCKIAATVANTYQKPIAGAEAYTAMVGKWKEYPATLKALGDRAFCVGINRYIVHRYAHQPWLNYEPGMNFGPYGLNYERTVTWWKPAAGAWNQYIARCQALLQQGHTVADVAVLLADDIPTKLGFRNDIWDPIPAGVDYDGFNLELLGRLTVDADGMLALPHGPRYRVLLLSDSRLMRPETLREISRLVEAGATVIGPPPLRSPSLMGYPDCDREVQELAARLWGNADGQSVTEQRFGKGRVIHGRPLAKVLAETGPPDFDFSSTNKDAEINYIHRRTADADIYFVASSGRVREKLLCRFRVSGRAPELFDPASGQITRPALYRVQDGVTEIPLDFAPSGSVFVVFRDATSSPPLVDLQRDGKPLWGAPFAPMPETEGGRTLVRLWDRGIYQFTKADGSGIKVSTNSLPDPLTIEGPWSLHFPPGRGAPEKVEIDVPGCWTKHPDEGVRHFSGTATYRKTIELPEGSLAPDREWHLDLVLVNHVAEVSVNGQAFPVLWKPPYMLDVTTALKPGRNEIAIAVTNLWLNRLIGDDKQYPLDIEFRGNNGPAEMPEWVKKGEPPPGGRTTFATWRLVKPGDPLSPSGLRGGITLRPAERVVIANP